MQHNLFQLNSELKTAWLLHNHKEIKFPKENNNRREPKILGFFILYNQ